MKTVAVLALLLLSLFGCTHLLIEKQHNVEPGDPDYPQENHAPKRIVDLMVSNTESVEYELRSEYRAPESEECRYLVNALEGAYSGFSVSVPTPVTEVRGEARARVVVDKFMPGRCGWQFFALVLVVSKDGKHGIGHIILSSPLNRLYRDNQNNGLFQANRTTDQSEVNLECDLSLIEKWHERGLNGQPCVVNSVRGGVGKLLTNEARSIHVRILESTIGGR